MPEDRPALRYFPTSSSECPTSVDDSEWTPLLDAEEYLRELDEQLADLGPGDSVLISGLGLDPALDLNGRHPGEPAYRALSERLAHAAVAGAVVRVILAGKVIPSSVRIPTVDGFRSNVASSELLREWRACESAPNRPGPLADCILIDYSGVPIGANHRKVVVVDRAGIVTAFVGGIDLVSDRFDAAPHDRLRLHGKRWGWHDAAVRLRGPAAGRVQACFGQWWRNAAALPARHYLKAGRLRRINPSTVAVVPQPVPQVALHRPGTSVRVLRSVAPPGIGARLPWRIAGFESPTAGSMQEVFETLVTAFSAAQRYIYIEDQYLQESVGGVRRFELYPYLRGAARRGVKVIMVGSGIRDPDDPGIHTRPINRSLNRDIQRKILEQLTPAQQANIAVFRIEHLTVHAKLTIIDDTFACIGSANMFSRAMSGIDNELSAAVTTTTSLVRDLRVRVWAEHLRAPLDADLAAALNDLDLALGMWDVSWLPPGAAETTWRAPAEPAGFRPAETVLQRVRPARAGPSALRSGRHGAHAGRTRYER